ncbi:hypothetical protein NQD34_007490 [Periophthalmus magnuspinnatus]|nr:hypothetical protein NQD34_007490 [Periophthalmus magnuspinnatus]
METKTETREMTEGPREQGDNTPEEMVQLRNIIEKYEKLEMERHRSKVSDSEVRRNIQREEPTRLEKKTPVCTGQVRRMRQCFEKQDSDQSRPNEVKLSKIKTLTSQLSRKGLKCKVGRNNQREEMKKTIRTGQVRQIRKRFEKPSQTKVVQMKSPGPQKRTSD